MKRSTRFALLLFLLLAISGCRPTATGAAASSSPARLQQEFRALIVQGRKLGPVSATLLLTSTAEGRRVERVRFDSEPGERIFAAIARPETAAGRLPAVIVQHYLGGTKDEPLIQALVWQLAAKGFLAIAIDGRYRGERGDVTLKQAINQSLESGKGHPWLIDTVYDDLRTIDYLQTRPDVDPARIGMVGISEGGLETWMAAAADARIAVAVPVIGVTRFAPAFTDTTSADAQARIKLFQPYLEPFAHRLGEAQVNARVVQTAWDRLVPGLRDRFDADQMLPLIAPRPLLILSHERDELFPLAGARDAFEAARRRYVALGVADHVQMQVAPGLPHKGQDPAETAALFAWLERWLKGSGSPGPAATPAAVSAQEPAASGRGK